jgi:hypothetical protein
MRNFLCWVSDPSQKVKQQKLQLETEVRSFRNMVMMQTTFLKFQYCLAIQAKEKYYHHSTILESCQISTIKEKSKLSATEETVFQSKKSWITYKPL